MASDHPNSQGASHPLSKTTRPHRNTGRVRRYGVDEIASSEAANPGEESREDSQDDNEDQAVNSDDIGDYEMGVYRKKTATRGGEGGVKYTCDVCCGDVTSTVSSCTSFAPTNVFKSLISASGPHQMRPQCLHRIRSLRVMLRKRRIFRLSCP